MNFSRASHGQLQVWYNPACSILQLGTYVRGVTPDLSSASRFTSWVDPVGLTELDHYRSFSNRGWTHSKERSKARRVQPTTRASFQLKGAHKEVSAVPDTHEGGIHFLLRVSCTTRALTDADAHDALLYRLHIPEKFGG
ncbi:hypothetical protein N657DRAFT_71236 [Parathielavia appendiculata]|uniref:Uncharacterized protein n=1 Tax=Parathielavia appendiculata TaxID=2587402 RepID=A0AAN6UAG0_9PEZI|nr:hypothetical protein N657DRAFT_71236 [Parathielavia appendiculata]